LKFLGKINEHRIHPLIKLKVDESLMDSKSNFRIKEKLEAENFHDDVIQYVHNLFAPRFNQSFFKSKDR